MKSFSDVFIKKNYVHSKLRPKKCLQNNFLKWVQNVFFRCVYAYKR